MAKILKTDGSYHDITDFSLKSLQKAVGGYIELVAIPHPKYPHMIVNEEGKYMTMKTNPMATAIFNGENQPFFDTIKGDVILLTEEDYKKME